MNWIDSNKKRRCPIMENIYWDLLRDFSAVPFWNFADSESEQTATGPKGVSFFAEEITWKLLDKREYEQVELDIDATDIQGTYSGAVRGANVSLEIKSIKNVITVQALGKDQIDTLDVYIGNNTWMDGTDRISIENNEYRIDKKYNYFIYSLAFRYLFFLF